MRIGWEESSIIIAVFYLKRFQIKEPLYIVGGNVN
jgi:hypothetical protein